MSPIPHTWKIALAGLLLLCTGPAVPLEPSSKSLREAVERNEIVPLKSILDWIENNYRGQVVEVELDSEGGDFGYEIDLLTPENAKIEFQFDARTGDLRSVSGKDIDRARRK